MLTLSIACCYLLVGCAFAVGFFARGYAVIVPQAREASLPARLLWLPAAVALWPILAWKWAQARDGGGNECGTGGPRR